MSDIAGAADKLLEVEPEVTEYEFAITGATGFTGAKDVHVGETVSINVGAEAVGVRIEKRYRKSSDPGADEGELQEYLVRKVIFKATGARIR